MTRSCGSLMYIFFTTIEVVVHRNHDVDEPDGDQRVEPFLDRRDEDVQFADEAGQRGHPANDKRKISMEKARNGDRRPRPL